jgi:hypothetical protein
MADADDGVEPSRSEPLSAARTPRCGTGKMPVPLLLTASPFDRVSPCGGIGWA